jgi:hypothetical protein
MWYADTDRVGGGYVWTSNGARRHSPPVTRRCSGPVISRPSIDLGYPPSVSVLLLSPSPISIHREQRCCQGREGACERAICVWQSLAHRLIEDIPLGRWTRSGGGLSGRVGATRRGRQDMGAARPDNPFQICQLDVAGPLEIRGDVQVQSECISDHSLRTGGRKISLETTSALEKGVGVFQADSWLGFDDEMREMDMLM